MPTLSKQYIVYGAGALVVMVVALAAFFLSPTLPFALFQKESVPVEKPVVETGTFFEKTDSYVIDMKYPQFGIESIDVKIKNGIDAFVADFKKEAEDHRGDVPYELTSNFAGIYADDHIVSARLSVSTFLGGAHPGTMIYGLNYAKDTGKEIGLKSVLTLIGATLTQVADYSSAELKKKLGDSFIPAGAAAKEENYWMYSINDKGVTFIFNEYQVAPYAAGPQRVSFARSVPVTPPSEQQ